MDPRIVARLERELERAVAQAFDQPESSQLPLHPSHKTVHLMAKAAVTVYETAVENRSRDKPMRTD